MRNLNLADLAFAFGVKRVVNDEFALKNFVIGQPECSETGCDPTQPFASRVRIGWTRIGRAHNFTEQKQGAISQFVFFQDGIEGNIFAIMAELAVRHVENNSVVDLRPVGVVRQKNKLGIFINKISDQPRTSDAVDLNFLARDPSHDLNSGFMAPWFWYAVVAAVLYGAHQIFTRLAADHIGEGLGGFVVEATAALSILLYLAFLWLASRWNQQSSAQGIFYSVITGICVGAGTIAFFLLFQKGGPLSSVPAILAGGAAIMAIAGIMFFREPISWQRLLGVSLAIIGLFLLRR